MSENKERDSRESRFKKNVVVGLVAVAVIQVLLYLLLRIYR